MTTSFLRACILITPTYLIATANATCNAVSWPPNIFQPTPYKGSVAPDYGIYWFKIKNGKNVVKKAFTPKSLAAINSNGTLNGNTPKNAKKYNNSLENDGFFKRTKPTLIFIHGDQPGSTKNKKRFSFCYDAPGAGTINTLPKILTKYNVGIFYYNQFADESPSSGGGLLAGIYNPERKIYSSNSSAGMKWSYLNKHSQVKYCNIGKKGCAPLPKDGTKTLNLAEITTRAYQYAFPKGYNNKVIIAGPSLGSQIVLQLTRRIFAKNISPKPSMIALLDPYFSKSTTNAPTIEGKSVGMYNFNNRPSLPILMYRTSTISKAMGSSKAIEKFSNNTYFVRICPNYLKSMKKTNRLLGEHISGSYIYFASFGNFKVPFPGKGNPNNLSGGPQQKYCSVEKFDTGCKITSSHDCAIEPLDRIFKKK